APAGGGFYPPGITSPYITIQNNTIYNMNPNNEVHTNSSCIEVFQAATTTNYVLNGTVTGNNLDAGLAQYCEVRSTQGGVFWQNNLISKGVAGWVYNVNTADAQGNQKPLNSTMVTGYLSNTTPFTLNNTSGVKTLPYDTIVTDSQGEWDPTHNAVQLKRRGRYLITANVTFQTISSNV